MADPWDIAGSFNNARLQTQRISQGDVDAAGQAAAGNALATMFNAAVPGAQPMGGPPGPQPGQPPQPNPPMQQGGQGGLLAQILGRLRQAPQMLAGGGPPQQPAMPASVPGAQPMPGSGPPAGPQTGGMTPPGQPGQGGMQPGGMGGQPSLDWRMIVQGVVKSNPGIKDPRVIAAAVDRFMPIMNQQSQMQWREVSQQLRANQLNLQQENLQNREQMDEWRRTHGDTQATQGQERIDQANKREERLSGSAAVRQDQGWQRLDLQKRQLERQITQGNQRQMLGQWRAVLDAQHKRAQEIIESQAAGVPDAERKKLLADEDKAYNDAIRGMRSGVSTGGEGAPAAPTGGEETKTISGKTYIKRDGQWYPKE